MRSATAGCSAVVFATVFSLFHCNGSFRDQAPVTLIFRGLALSALGRVIVRTPSRRSASTRSALTFDRQAHDAAERADRPLAAVIGDALLGNVGTVDLDRQIVAGHRDVELFALDAGQLHLDLQGVFLLPDVDGGLIAEDAGQEAVGRQGRKSPSAGGRPRREVGETGVAWIDSQRPWQILLFRVRTFWNSLDQDRFAKAVPSRMAVDVRRCRPAIVTLCWT